MYSASSNLRRVFNYAQTFMVKVIFPRVMLCSSTKNMVVSSADRYMYKLVFASNTLLLPIDRGFFASCSAPALCFLFERRSFEYRYPKRCRLSTPLYPSLLHAMKATIPKFTGHVHLTSKSEFVERAGRLDSHFGWSWNSSSHPSRSSTRLRLIRQGYRARRCRPSVYLSSSPSRGFAPTAKSPGDARRTAYRPDR